MLTRLLVAAMAIIVVTSTSADAQRRIKRNQSPDLFETYKPQFGPEIRYPGLRYFVMLHDYCQRYHKKPAACSKRVEEIHFSVAGNRTIRSLVDELADAEHADDALRFAFVHARLAGHLELTQKALYRLAFTGN